MNIHRLRWDGPDSCPQKACERRLAAKLPFVLLANFDVKIGDLLEFPDYFVNYPVLRYAGHGDSVSNVIKDNNHIAVVCAEPPKELEEYNKMRDDALAEYKKQFTTAIAA